MPLPKELDERLVNLGTDGGVHFKVKTCLCLFDVQLTMFPLKNNTRSLKKVDHMHDRLQNGDTVYMHDERDGE